MRVGFKKTKCMFWNCALLSSNSVRAGDKDENSDCSGGSVTRIVLFPTHFTRNLHFLGVVQRQTDVWN